MEWPWEWLFLCQKTVCAMPSCFPTTQPMLATSAAILPDPARAYTRDFFLYACADLFRSCL